MPPLSSGVRRNAFVAGAESVLDELCHRFAESGGGDGFAEIRVVAGGEDTPLVVLADVSRQSQCGNVAATAKACDEREAVFERHGDVADDRVELFLVAD